MGLQVEMLAAGTGWSVSEAVCSSGPSDRPFEERHPSVCIAAVMQGNFQYRSSKGAATLVPGAVLLGNYASCFECGHEHGTGDRCLSFMFDPDTFEDVLASVPGSRSLDFRVPGLPPLMSLSRVFAEAEMARSTSDPVWLEQVGLDLAAASISLVADCRNDLRDPGYRDQKRIAGVLRRIEEDAHSPLGIGEMAREAGMSPYHFLRTFGGWLARRRTNSSCARGCNRRRCNCGVRRHPCWISRWMPGLRTYRPLTAGFGRSSG